MMKTLWFYAGVWWRVCKRTRINWPFVVCFAAFGWTDGRREMWPLYLAPLVVPLLMATIGFLAGVVMFHYRRAFRLHQ